MYTLTPTVPTASAAASACLASETVLIARGHE
jgi:hypothetical protein